MCNRKCLFESPWNILIILMAYTAVCLKSGSLAQETVELHINCLEKKMWTFSDKAGELFLYCRCQLLYLFSFQCLVVYKKKMNNNVHGMWQNKNTIFCIFANNNSNERHPAMLFHHWKGLGACINHYQLRTQRKRNRNRVRTNQGKQSKKKCVDRLVSLLTFFSMPRSYAFFCCAAKQQLQNDDKKRVVVIERKNLWYTLDLLSLIQLTTRVLFALIEIYIGFIIRKRRKNVKRNIGVFQRIIIEVSIFFPRWNRKTTWLESFPLTTILLVEIFLARLRVLHHINFIEGT